MGHTAREMFGTLAEGASTGEATNAQLRARRRLLVAMVDESAACTEECHAGWVEALTEFDAAHPGLAFDAEGEPTASEAAFDAAMTEGAF